MPRPTSSPSDSGYETGGNAEEDDEYDFYAHNRPPTPRTPELFPTPPRHKMQRLAREQQAAADAAAAEQLRQRLLAEQQKQEQKKKRGNAAADDDDNHGPANDPDPNVSRARACSATLAQEEEESSSQDSSYDIIPDDEVAAARRKEAEALERKHDEEYFKRVTDQSISGFGVHAVQEGLKDLKMRAEPFTKRLEESKWLKKPVGTPQEMQCPCWNYPDGGWRFCSIHEGQHSGGSGEDDDDEDEGVVVDEDEIDDDGDDDELDEDDEDDDELDEDDEDGGVCIGSDDKRKQKLDW